MEQLYEASGLVWFAVRPEALVNAPPSRSAREVAKFRSVSVIGRADVAERMLDAIAQPAATRTRRTPMIGWW